MNKADYTKRALIECVFAFHRPEWILRLIPANGDGPVISVNYNSSQFIASYKYLRAKNMEGYHVFGRPVATRHILIDDLDEYMIDQLTNDGFQPSLVVLTSIDNYQAWITVSDENIPYELATASSKILANRFGGDTNSAKASQLGRIPGLTNRKLIHQDSNGMYPFTRVVGIPRPRVATNSTELLNEAKSLMVDLPPSSSTLRGCVLNNSIDSFNLLDPNEGGSIYQEAVNDLSKYSWFTFTKDRSRTDFAVAKHLFINGFNRSEVHSILFCGSDKANKRGHEYVNGTVLSAESSIRKSSN